MAGEVVGSADGGAGGAGGASAVSVVSVAAAVSVVVVLPEAGSSVGVADDAADGWAGASTCVPDADPEDAVPEDAVSVWLEPVCPDAVSGALLSTSPVAGCVVDAVWEPVPPSVVDAAVPAVDG